MPEVVHDGGGSEQTHINEWVASAGCVEISSLVRALGYTDVTEWYW